MFDRFTDRARRVVVLAQEEARQFNHNYIGTEHLLLALIREGEAGAAKALAEVGVSAEAVAAKMEPGKQTPTGHIPFTPTAKRALELALREALQLGHNCIGTEHLLLALVAQGQKAREEEESRQWPARSRLVAAGLLLEELAGDLTAVRKAVIKQLVDVPPDLKAVLADLEARFAALNSQMTYIRDQLREVRARFGVVDEFVRGVVQDELREKENQS
jgi:ATP-dependent Clp protease ATP-binding subunit ClpA